MSTGRDYATLTNPAAVAANRAGVLSAEPLFPAQEDSEFAPASPAPGPLAGLPGFFPALQPYPHTYRVGKLQFQVRPRAYPAVVSGMVYRITTPRSAGRW